MASLSSDMGDAVMGCAPLNMGMVRAQLDRHWTDHVLRDVHGLRAAFEPGPVVVRDVPDTCRTGFQCLTYMQWFGGQRAKGQSFLYHVDRPQRIKALARFVFGGHGLAIETGRFQHHKPRNQRVCLCCAPRVRGDEMHMLQCPVNIDIRHAYSDLFEGFPSVHEWSDETMRRFMNRGSDKRGWNRLADMLMGMQARHKSIVALAMAGNQEAEE
jgi:hypothetical protein